MMGARPETKACQNMKRFLLYRLVSAGEIFNSAFLKLLMQCSSTAPGHHFVLFFYQSLSTGRNAIRDTAEHERLHPS